MSNTKPQTAIATMHDVTAIDEHQASALANRVKARFPQDCSPQQAMEVARIAIVYGLDPLLGELIPYQGQPYVTINGRVRVADNNPMFDGYDIEPATEQEYRALRAHDAESVWKCIVYRKDRRRPTVAYGRAGGPQEKNPVAARWTAEIAQKRAIHRALRAAFPMPIPGLEESLSPAQLRAIHAADEDAGIDRDERHHTLVETYGVESSAELTSGQASVYLDDRTVSGQVEVDGDGVIVEASSADDFDGDGRLIAPRVTGDPSDDVPAMLRLLDTANTPKRYAQAKDYITQIGLHADPEIAGVLDERDRRIAARRSQG